MSHRPPTEAELAEWAASWAAFVIEEAQDNVVMRLIAEAREAARLRGWCEHIEAKLSDTERERNALLAVVRELADLTELDGPHGVQVIKGWSDEFWSAVRRARALVKETP